MALLPGKRLFNHKVALLDGVALQESALFQQVLEAAQHAGLLLVDKKPDLLDVLGI